MEIASIFLTIIALIMFMMVRHTIVFICRMKEVHRLHDKAMAIIHARQTYDHDSIWGPYKNGQTSDQQAFDLTKWTHKQFYPKHLS